MRSLGLLPPYAVQDVQQAYLARVKAAHPDAGGDVDAFCRLQEDFERATEHVTTHCNRLRWIASQVDRYVVQQLIVAEIGKFGGTVEMERVDWLREPYGDFAQLADKVVGIDLRGPRVGDGVLADLARQQTAMPALQKLDLAFSHITDEGLQHLRTFCSLRRLNLQGTRITDRGLSALRLPALEWLNVKGTSISWWGLAKLRWRVPALAAVAPDGKFRKGRNRRYGAATNGMFVQDGHAALLARIAEIRSWKGC